MFATDFKSILVFLGEKNAEISKIKLIDRRRLVSKILQAAIHIAGDSRKPATYVRVGKKEMAILNCKEIGGIKVIEDSREGFGVGNSDVEYGGGI